MFSIKNNTILSALLVASLGCSWLQSSVPLGSLEHLEHLSNRARTLMTQKQRVTDNCDWSLQECEQEFREAYELEEQIELDAISREVDKITLESISKFLRAFIEELSKASDLEEEDSDLEQEKLEPVVEKRQSKTGKAER